MDIKTIRRFVEFVRWYTVIHSGNLGLTYIRIGIYQGSLRIEMETRKFVEIMKPGGDIGDAAEVLIYLLSNMDQEDIPDVLQSLIEAFTLLEAGYPGEDAIILDKSLQGAGKLQFRDRAEVLK